MEFCRFFLAYGIIKYMEPSYNSGQGYPGMRPGGTFSGPGLRPGGNYSGSGMGSGGAFSGSNIPSPAPLPMSQAPRKSRRGLIIGLILVAVVIVVAVVAVVVLRSNQGGQTGTQDSNFYRYANYLINGTESTNANIGEYDDGLRSFAVVEAFDSKNTVYFDKLNELWGKVYKPIESSEGPIEITSEILLTSVQNSAINFLTRSLQMDDWSFEDILKLYNENGYSKMVQMLDGSFSKIKDTKYSVGIKAYEEYTNYLKSVLRIIARYDNLGCLTDGVVDQDCVSANREETLSDWGFVVYEGGVRDAEYRALGELLDACYEMNKLKGEQ